MALYILVPRGRAPFGQLPFVLVTDWSDANTIKNDKPEEKLHHEAWRKGTNKVNFCGKNHPLDLLGEKAMKKGIGRALESFSGVKISLAIVFHVESNVQNSPNFRSF